MTVELSDVEICRLYETGIGVPELQKRTGRSQCYIDRRLDLGGVIKRGAGRLPGKPRPERCKPLALKEETLRLYGAGIWAREIARRLPVSKPTVLRWAREAGFAIRSQKIATPEIGPLHVSGCSGREISRLTGLGRKLVTRRLRAAVHQPQSKHYVKWYWHESPTNGRLRVHGTWELAYARALDRWCSDGRIAGWRYEPGQLKLGPGLNYRPDFKVFSLDGRWAYHEVKGAMWRRSAEKIAITRETVAPVVLIRRPMLTAICAAEGILFDGS